MNWAAWASLFGAALAGTVLAGAFYFHWATRYTKAWLGITSELALLILIVMLGCASITYLIGHTPR